MKKQSTNQRLVALNFRVPLDLRRRLKIHAASRSITMTNLLLELLERFDIEAESDTRGTGLDLADEQR
jgi:hypothetical protein